MKENEIDLQELMENNTHNEFRAICRFIAKCKQPLYIYMILEEIRCVHDNLFAFNPHTRLVSRVESTLMNGDSIQLNLEGFAEVMRGFDDRECEALDSNPHKD